MSEVQAQRTHEGWQAKLSLSLRKRSDKTVISELKHCGPLRIQRPFYPEGETSHVYLLHPPGGVVGGDSIDISICAKAGSHGLFTTPGATKFYRSAGRLAEVKQTLSIEKDASLEWFPQENILFPGACLNMKTRVNLADSARVIAWEINCLGRPVNQELFSSGQLSAGFNLYRNDKPVLIEKQRVFSTRDLNSSSGLRNYPMQAVFIANRVHQELLEECRELVEQMVLDFPVGLTLLDDVLVLRALSTRTQKLQSVMIAVWKKIRPEVLGKHAEVPRIWAT